MPNRVIKDSIWSSPTLAKLPLDAQLHWPRWLLMADDWGCFNADPDVIRGLVYPKVPSMTIKKIFDLCQTYVKAGLLFLWEESERLWGYFTSWNGHQFCNVTHLDEDGKQLRHKRKTSEPPENELKAYLEQHKQISQSVSRELERIRAGQNKYRNPNPNPNPNPKTTIVSNSSANAEDSRPPSIEPSNGHVETPEEWKPVETHLRTLTILNQPELYDWTFWKRLDEGHREFPDLSICDELSKAEAWLLANPRKAATKKHWKRFILNWFTNATTRKVRYEKSQPYR